MADRSIVVRLKAQVDGFKRDMAEAAKATEKVAEAGEKAGTQSHSAFGGMLQSAQQNRAAWDTAGTAMTGFGAATLGGLTLATKAAMDWQSSWAGVMKTVDASPAQYAALEDGLRGLARELPATHQEIAAVAEAAGQLGVRREDIVGFTRTMINLGETTNLSAEEAATAIAQFTNVMGTSSDDVGRFGSTLVALGNAGASTERDIMMMASRLSGTGKLIGASETEILGLSSALSDVGISAEAGGGALSRVLQGMNTAVLGGGEQLQRFADVAGVSASTFAAAWRESPTQALDMFLQGLNGVTASGGNAVGVLSDLGIKSTEETRALLSLAGAGDALSSSLDTANAGWAANTALIDEASKRYGTAESRIALARNALVDAGISIGSTVLPALAGIADGAAGVLGFFADLPGPIQGAVAALGGIAGAGSLAGGAFLLLAPRLLETVSAFRTLKQDMPVAAGRLAGVAKGITAIGVAATVFPFVIEGAHALEDAITGLNRAALDQGPAQLTRNLLDAADSGDAFNSILGDLYVSGAVTTGSFANLSEAISGVARLQTDPFARIGKSLNLTDTDVALLNDRFAGTGEALKALAQTDLPSAQASFSAFWAEASAGGTTFDEAMMVLPGFKDELVNLANQMGVGTDNATLLKIATGELVPVTDSATGAVTGYKEGLEAAVSPAEELAAKSDALNEAMQTMASNFLGARAAARDYADALEEANAAADENGKHWEDGTEAAQKNAEAIDAMSSAALANIDAMHSNGEASGAAMQSTRDEIIATAREMDASQEEAEAYADALGLTPEAIRTQVEFDTSQAWAAWEALYGQDTPKVYSEAFLETGQYKNELSGIISLEPPDVNVTATAETESAIANMYGFQSVIEGTPKDVAVGVSADTTVAQAELARMLLEVESAGGTIEIDGNPVSAEQAILRVMAQANGSSGTITINGNGSPAAGALNGTVSMINNANGTLTIKGNNAPAKAAVDAIQGKTVYVDIVSRAVNVARAAQPSMRAGGGPITGPGTGTSDSVPIWASNGEHMLTAHEVSLLGGQGATYRMREAIRSGALRFDVGGAIGEPRDLRQAAWVPQPRFSAAEAPARPATTFAPSFQITGADPAAVARESVSLMRQEARAMAVVLPGGR